MNSKSVGVIAAALLFLAIFSLPIGYFTLLRWVICVCALYYSSKAYEAKNSTFMLIFLGIAAVFNPIIPVHLTKAGWAPIDLITAVLFLIPLGKKKA